MHTETVTEQPTRDNRRSRPRRLLSIGITLAVIAAVAGLAVKVIMPRFRPYVFHGSVIQSSEKAPRVSLESGDGPVSLSDFEGEVVVLYFGYTFCPDVCPTTLAKLARAMDQLGERADEVNVVMVSVDPERDTPEKVSEYVRHFDPRFIGVTGPPDVIDRVATVYGVYYETEQGSAATGYLVNHTATLMLVDREGYLKVVLPFEGTSEEIAADIEYLLEH